MHNTTVEHLDAALKNRAIEEREELIYLRFFYEHLNFDEMHETIEDVKLWFVSETGKAIPKGY
jgi:predicted SAM-dependent methyltransferase